MQTASNDIVGDAPPRGGSGSEGWFSRGVRGGVLALAVLASSWTLGGAWTSSLRGVRSPGPASVPELAAFATASLAGGLGAWLLLGVVLELAAHLPGRCGRLAQGWSQRVSPALARRAAGLVLGIGVGVVGGPAQAVAVGAPVSVSATAHPLDGGLAPDPGFGAAPVPVEAPTHRSRSEAPGTSAPAATPAPTPGFVPSPPRVRPQADPRLIGSRVGPRTDGEVVVHRGDSLWSIAATHLGRDASDAEVDRAWREWFLLNRDVVGADPDLLLPGQVLRVPGPDVPTGGVR